METSKAVSDPWLKKFMEHEIPTEGPFNVIDKRELELVSFAPFSTLVLKSVKVLVRFGRERMTLR